MKVKIKIYGLVQGVFFRESAEEKAKELNISLPRRASLPNPQNMPDSTVEIVAEGKQENLNKFIDWCKIGPDLAKVDKIEVSYETD